MAIFLIIEFASFSKVNEESITTPRYFTLGDSSIHFSPTVRASDLNFLFRLGNDELCFA